LGSKIRGKALHRSGADVVGCEEGMQGLVWVSMREIDVDVNVKDDNAFWGAVVQPCVLMVQARREMQAMANTYTISDLAQEFDLTTRAIRFYEDMGLLEPERSGPGGRNRVYSARDRTRLKLTLRAKRLGLSLNEAKDLIDMYDSPRDTVPQLKKFLVVLAEHRQQLESQLSDLEATLDEVKTHEKETRNLLVKATKNGKPA
jgi:DNA-binding transcriptional MerR regulator